MTLRDGRSTVTVPSRNYPAQLCQRPPWASRITRHPEIDAVQAAPDSALLEKTNPIWRPRQPADPSDKSPPGFSSPARLPDSRQNNSSRLTRYARPHLQRPSACGTCSMGARMSNRRNPFPKPISENRLAAPSSPVTARELLAVRDLSGPTARPAQIKPAA